MFFHFQEVELSFVADFFCSGQQPVAESSGPLRRWWKMLLPWENWPFGDFPGSSYFSYSNNFFNISFCKHQHWSYVATFFFFLLFCTLGIYTWFREGRGGAQETADGILLIGLWGLPLNLPFETLFYLFLTEHIPRIQIGWIEESRT